MVGQYYKYAFFLVIGSFPSQLLGQGAAQTSHGNTLKYDKDFHGIGPRVYELPEPRTLREELTDTYAEIASFQHDIAQALIAQQLLAAYKIIPYQDSGIIDWKKAIAETEKAEDWKSVYAMLNAYAKNLATAKDFASATQILAQADSIAQIHGTAKDLATLQSNMSTLLLLVQDPQAASKHEEQFFNQASKTKDRVTQAESLLKSALIFALEKNYAAAENTIIRQAIPLFNKAKNYAGKVWAWQNLANIYQQQGKHTEAQWFLLQARALAKSKKIDAGLPQLEYMLGYSKMTQEKFALAKNELQSAYDMLDKKQNNLLKLAIVEQLGKACLQLNEVNLSNRYLQEYWSLRKMLFG